MYNNYDPNLYNYNKQNTLVNYYQNDTKGGDSVDSVEQTKEKKVSLDEILDRVEEGDVSVLIELGISYTQFNENGILKLSFKYEGVRYTVSVVSKQTEDVSKPNSQEDLSQESTNKTRTEKYDDGSYSVYETYENNRDIKRTDYYADGSLMGVVSFTYRDDGTLEKEVKTQGNNVSETNYDSNGRIIKEIGYENGSVTRITEWDNEGRVSYDYVVNEDGSRSDFYYTYDKNGKLEQTQQTIHYENGDYTYIHTNGEGNLTENQKVIHNPDGSMTFDCTFGDGRRHVMNNNSDGTMKNTIYYNPDGSVKQTEEYSYNPIDSNKYTVTTRNGDGVIMAVANLENYKIEDGDSAWYGSTGKTTRFNPDGTIELITESSIDENHVETVVTKNGQGKIINKFVFDFVNFNSISQEIYDNDGNFVERIKYEYLEDGSCKNIIFDVEGNVTSVEIYKDGELVGVYSPEDLIRNAFEYKNAPYDGTIGKPLSYTFGIPMTGEPNSTVEGKGSYGTGRVDDYVATYDEFGRLSSITTSNSKYGETKEVTYSYSSNGEMTETESTYFREHVEKITTVYNADNTLKTQVCEFDGKDVISRNFSYSLNEHGESVQLMINSANRMVKTTLKSNGKYTEEYIEGNKLIKDAFAYDGEDALQHSVGLQYDYVIDTPRCYTFNIPLKGEPNSQVEGEGRFKSGRVDHYAATYDSKGRISVIETDKNERITYTYSTSGEMTETLFDNNYGAVVKTEYNENGSIKSHSEYMSTKDYRRRNSVVTRDYTYSFNEYGEPVQTMTNSVGVVVRTTRKSDGTYAQTRLSKKEIMQEKAEEQRLTFVRNNFAINSDNKVYLYDESEMAFVPAIPELKLMKPEDYENEPTGTVAKNEDGTYKDANRIVAKDADGNLYDYDKNENAFIIRTAQRVLDCAAKKIDNSEYNFDALEASLTMVRDKFVSALKAQGLEWVSGDIAIDENGNVYEWQGKTFKLMEDETEETVVDTEAIEKLNNIKEKQTYYKNSSTKDPVKEAEIDRLTDEYNTVQNEKTSWQKRQNRLSKMLSHMTITKNTHGVTVLQNRISNMSEQIKQLNEKLTSIETELDALID